jgi:hypothetical protein
MLRQEFWHDLRREIQHNQFLWSFEPKTKSLM